MTISTRIFWLNRRAERAEALAALVTERTADLLENLAYQAGNVSSGIAAEVLELAAQIREALDDSQA